jgi:hypothetical protein
MLSANSNGDQKELPDGSVMDQPCSVPCSMMTNKLSFYLPAKQA